MKAYRLLLAFFALAFVAAITAWSIGDDPGYVLLQRGQWAVESSLVFAVLALLVLWMVLAGLLWLLRFPLRAMAARARRRGRLQFSRGVQALAEGRTQRAEQLLLGASRLRSLRLPALLAAYSAVRTRGEARRQGDLLAAIAATGEGETAATVLRAQAELDHGRAGTAIELLTPLDQAQRLPPAGVRTFVEALAARGRAREAISLLSRLRRSQSIASAEMERVETRVLTAALAQAADGAALEATWGELDRGQRREQPVALAYAERAAVLRAGGAAIGEIEALLGKYWNDALIAAWARLPGDAEPRLRKAEAWLAAHPNSPGLLLALGELCRGQSLWGKADTYLRRALGAGAGGEAWEQLGHAYAAQNDTVRAAHAYASALAAQRGESLPDAPSRAGIGALITPIAIVEERNEMGVPRLPQGG